ncbi:hypothetical protein RHECNPAF_35000113 [Rhizobium etli CNPAF512]|nr:hypothetical protein RHECNPAF_35000113 [Rhizobium etli CNPAF512]
MKIIEIYRNSGIDIIIRQCAGVVGEASLNIAFSRGK